MSWHHGASLNPQHQIIVQPAFLPIRRVQHTQDFFTGCPHATHHCARAASSQTNTSGAATATRELALLTTPPTSLATPAEEVADWIRSSYSTTYSRTAVLSKVQRAEAALLAVDPSRQHISLDTDVLPKTELLDALSPGLGWRIFSRYPEEFGHPDAEDYWKIMAALLYTTGFSPNAVSSLFKRHLCLFARTVQDPLNLKLLFEWLRELGFKQPEIMKIINKFPLVLQTNVETVLKPRLAFIESLGVDRHVAVKILKRHPEFLGLDSSSLQERIDFLKEECGLNEQDIARMVATQPAALMLRTAERLEPAVKFLREELGCEGPLLHRMITSSGLLTRSAETIRTRVKVLEDFGVSRQILPSMLRRFSRLLCYPLNEPKYQRKLQFLREIIGGGPAELVSFPQYLSYSIEDRIAPRVAAVHACRGKKAIPPLSPLARKLESFVEYYGMTVEEYCVAVERWGETEEGRKWLRDPDEEKDSDAGSDT